MKNTIRVKKAVIPAAGLGTRWLPITKSVPKEILPVNLKPMIQYAVEEAVKSGIKEILFVIRKDKEIIRDYFTGNTNKLIAERKEIKRLKELRQICRFHFTYQKSPKGLMDAISLGKEFVKNEPFAVLLPDNIMVSRTPCLKQIIRLHADSPQNKKISYVILKQFKGRTGHAEVDIDRVQAELISKTRSEYRINHIKEKKKQAVTLKKGQTGLKIFGRYIFSGDIFDYIKKYRIEYRGEFDDTPIFSRLAEEGKLRGKLYNGLIFDTGNLDGYSEASLHYMK